MFDPRKGQLAEDWQDIEGARGCISVTSLDAMRQPLSISSLHFEAFETRTTFHIAYTFLGNGFSQAICTGHGFVKGPQP